MNLDQSQQELPKPRMKFTPLKVRGKKGASNQAQQPTGTIKHRPEESLTEVADLASKPKRQRRIKPRRAGSALIERLPLEILELIFILSENTNFPKSSPYIGCTLSSRLTLLRLVVEAFAPTWDVWFGCVPETVRSYYGWERDDKRFGGDPQFQVPDFVSCILWAVCTDGALQSHVLACHRVDVSVLLDAQKLWLRQQTAPRLLGTWHFPLGRIYTHPEPPVDRDKPATSEVFERLFEWEWHYHSVWCHKLAYQADHDGETLRIQLRDDDFDAGPEDRLQQVSFELLSMCNTPSSIDMHPKVRIPDELLVGPLDWAKAKLLFWFIRQRAQLDDQQTWEVSILSQSDDTIKLTRW